MIRDTDDERQRDHGYRLLLGHFEKAVNSWIRHYGHGLDYDDCHSEILTVLLEIVERFDAKRGNFASLWKTAAIRRMITRRELQNLPRRGGGHNVSLSLFDSKFQFIDDCHYNAVDQADQCAYLWGVIAEYLTDQEYEALRLYVGGHGTYEEVGELIGITKTQVDNAIFRARTKLKNSFIKEGLFSGIVERRVSA
jgi:RNA polymerase sigma factor (sigma-70 family)